MSPVAELLRDLGAAFDRLDTSWYLFGAQAAILHGAARLTADVDVTVAPGSRSIDELLDALIDHELLPRADDPVEFAERTRVIPMAHEATGIPVDIVLAGPGLEEIFLERCEVRVVDGVRVPLVLAEDLIAMKILAGRPKDVADAVAVASAQRDRLDLALVRSTLSTLEKALARSDLEPALDEVLRGAGWS